MGIIRTTITRYILFFILLFPLLRATSRQRMPSPPDSVVFRKQIEYAKSLRFRLPDSAKQLSNRIYNLTIQSNFQYETALIENLLGCLDKDKGYAREAVSHFEASVRIFKSLSDSASWANGWNNIGLTLTDNDDFERAVIYFDSALSIYKLLRDSADIAYTHTNRGQLFRRSGQYLLAADEYFTSLSWFEKQHDRKSIAGVFNNLGIVYEKLGRWRKAIDYHEKALVLKSEPFSRAITKVNLGIVYGEAGKWREAEKKLLEAYFFFDSIQYPEGLGAAASSLGKVAMQTGRENEAQHYFYRSLAIAESLNSSSEIATCLNGLAVISLSAGRWENAFELARRSFHLSAKHGMIEQQAEAARLLADCYGKKTDYKNQSDYLQQYIMLHDSLLSKNEFHQFDEIEKKYDLDKQKLEQALSQQQQEALKKNIATQKKYVIVLVTMLGGLFLVMVALSVFYRRNLVLWRTLKENNRALSQQKELMETVNQELREKAMRAQMNPHFIFNALNSIQYLVLKNDHQQAFHYLSTFSVLLRRTLEYSNLPEITLSDEIKILESYLQLEALRFDNTFNYTICNSVEAEKIKIPPLIIQPIIENAIVHGLMTKKGKRNLTISFRKSDYHVICEIQDNGIGRIEAIKNKSRKALTTQSVGLQLSQERLSVFNHSLKKDALCVEDLQDESGNSTGTKVTLTFNYGNKSNHR